MVASNLAMACSSSGVRVTTAIPQRCAGSCQIQVAPRLMTPKPFLAGTVVGASAPRLSHRSPRSRHLQCSASVLTVKDSATGVEFPLVNNFWVGDTYRSMGAGARVKKIAFVGVKVYAVTLYVEADKAARELGVRSRGGFFESEDDYCTALSDGAFSKVLQLEMARTIEGAQFVEALNEALEPRMRLTGEMATLEQFKVFFLNRNIEKGTTVLLMWRQPDSLDVLVTADKYADFTQMAPDLSVQSAGLCRALFEVYLGSSSVVPEARGEWANGAKLLISSDDIRRETRKG